jgi:hypothetical protein
MIARSFVKKALQVSKVFGHHLAKMLLIEPTGSVLSYCSVHPYRSLSRVSNFLKWNRKLLWHRKEITVSSLRATLDMT